jgi:hypothetical protein
MSRPRRLITPKGNLRCTKCQVAKHISEFYAVKRDEVWFTDMYGEEWPKPQSWCKDCVRGHQAVRTPADAEIEELDREAEGVAAGSDPEGQEPDWRESFVPLGPPPSPERQPHPADDPNWLTPEDIEALNPTTMEVSRSEEIPTEP